MVIDESNPEVDFEPQRRHLMAMAYHLVGSLAEAEDLVQETYLRWHDTDRSTILNVRAFLSKVLVRLCLDHLKKARVRREQYIGEWLPEPVAASRRVHTHPNPGEILQKPSFQPDKAWPASTAFERDERRRSIEVSCDLATSVGGMAPEAKSVRASAGRRA